MSPYVFGLAFACIVELLLAGWRTVRKGRANRARFESDLRAIRSEVERIAEVGNSTSTRAAAIGDTVITAVKEMRSRFESLQHHTEKLSDWANELSAQIETLSKRVDTLTRDQDDSLISVKSLAQSIVTLTTDVAQVKQIAGQLGTQLASIESNFGDLQTRITLTESSVAEIALNKGVCTRESHPDKHGGRPRETERGNGGTKPITTLSPPKPQLIARRDAGDWQIYVDVEHVTSGDLRVVQGEAELNEVNGAEPPIFGPLLDLTSPIKILCNGSEPIESALITKDNPAFIFRMIQKGFARNVRHLSSGLNLVVVPMDWRYSAATSGSPPVEPEPLGIPEYTVHYYSPDHGKVLAFDRPSDEPFELATAKSRFRLDGRQLDDAERRMGPLFIGDPPVLRADCDAPMQVETIVIGDEGRGTAKWKRAYEPNGISNGGWPLSPEIRNQAIGWYFVRLYDANGDLVDSLDFRYISGLSSIDINSVYEQGIDDKICVTFTHDESVSVRPLNAGASILGQPVTSQHGSTTFVWPYDPSIREARFQVERRGRIVRVSVDTDRTWWARVDPCRHNEPSWRSASIELMLNDFEPTSNIKLWIRVPRSTSDTTSVGFDLDDRRNIGAPGSDGTRIIRLHEYSEAPELTRLGNHTLYLWLRDSAKETRIEIAKVKVFKQCPWCERRGADPEELITHLLAEHQDQLFERLVLRGEGVSTDRKSRLVCLGVEFGEKSCGETFSQSSLPDENAFTLLNRHWNSRHQGNLSYKIVDSPHNLPGDQEKWIWKCKIDSTHAIIPPPNDDASLADKKAHLREHLFDLFHQT